MVQPGLPQELLDMFVDELQAGKESKHLDSSSKKSFRLALRTCLFVSRSVCHRARRHLFATITLAHHSWKSLPPYMRKLLEILHSELPIGGVAHYIKKAVICLAEGIPSTGPIDESVDKGLVAILRSGIGGDDGIREISFMVLCPGGGGNLHWGQMSVDLRESLVDAIRSSHLTRVHFFNVCDIPRMVFVNTGLKHLRLKSNGWKASQDSIQAQGNANTPVQTHPTSGLAPVYPQLESFKTDHSYPIEYFEDNTPGSHSVSPFSCLSTLSSTIKAPQDFTDCMKILNRTAGTIENLHIYFFYQIEAPPKPLDFKLFPRLYLLEILYWSHATIGRFEDGIHNILRLLDCPSTSNTLSSIHFTINLSGASTFPLDGLFPSVASPATEWLALDNLLSGPKYSSVQTISFRFHIEFSAKPVTPSEDTYIIEAVDCVKRVFSLTSKLGLLKIAVEIV